MKNLFRTLVLLLVATLLFGCTTPQSNPETPDTGGETPTDTIKMAYTTQTLANPYFVTVIEGLEAYADEKNIDLTVTDGKQDSAAQISQIENFIAQKFDVIIITPVNDKALEDVVKQAKEAGIVVIAANQDVPGSDGFVTIPEYALGKSLGDVTGQYLAEHFGDEAVEVVVFDYPEVEAIIARGDGIRDGIKEYAPNAVIVQSISANTPEKGAAAMETVLQTHPNVQALAGVNDAGVLGAYEVIMSAGKDSEKFYVGGMDATQQALELIKQDTIFRATIDINPKGTGKILIDTALQVLNSGPLSEEIAIPLVPVTIDNVDEFLE